MGAGLNLHFSQSQVTAIADAIGHTEQGRHQARRGPDGPRSNSLMSQFN